MVQTKALRKLWMSVSSEDAERMVELLDADHNGQISLDEFRRFVYLLPESLVSPTPFRKTASLCNENIVMCSDCARHVAITQLWKCPRWAELY